MAVILLSLGALLIVVLLYVATKPNTFRVERSLRIDARPEQVFGWIDDYRRWPAWSPYEQLDPDMKKTFSGAPSGRGAVYEWQGRRAGKGRIEILQSSPPSKILMQLDMFTPIEGHNTVEFTLTPQGSGTEVTWAMYGPTRYLSKLMGMFFNMDRMVGGQFEQGLASLQKAARDEATALRLEASNLQGH